MIFLWLYLVIGVLTFIVCASEYRRLKGEAKSLWIFAAMSVVWPIAIVVCTIAEWNELNKLRERKKQ
jgi:hypothetical protein